MRVNRANELTKFKTDINLVEYAASQGYVLNKQKSSKNSKVMKSADGDKIIIATDNDNHGVYFSVNRGDSGSIIDFVQARQGLNLGEVRKELRNFSGFSDVPEYQNYKKPLKSSKEIAQAAYALESFEFTTEHPYLLNERGINKTILNDVRFSKSVKIDAKHSNAIFPHFNSFGVSGYEIKNNEFTGFAKGGEKGLWYSSNIMRAEKIVVVESAIDALSHAQLKGTGEETAYISIAGSMSDSQLELVKTVTDDKQTIIATDRDKSGNQYAMQIREFAPDAIRDIPKNKDWNADLKAQNQEIELSRQNSRDLER